MRSLKPNIILHNEPIVCIFQYLKALSQILTITFLTISWMTYNPGKQTWHIEHMASLVANNDIILHQNLFDIIDMSKSEVSS